MPRKRDGYTQLNLELPDAVVEALRLAAEESGQKLTPWICSVLAERIGVEYTPPRLGRPPTPPPPPTKRRRGK